MMLHMFAINTTGKFELEYVSSIFWCVAILMETKESFDPCLMEHLGNGLLSVTHNIWSVQENLSSFVKYILAPNQVIFTFMNYKKHDQTIECKGTSRCSLTESMWLSFVLVNYLFDSNFLLSAGTSSTSLLCQVRRHCKDY